MELGRDLTGFFSTVFRPVWTGFEGKLTALSQRDLTAGRRTGGSWSRDFGRATWGGRGSISERRA